MNTETTISQIKKIDLKYLIILAFLCFISCFIIKQNKQIQAIEQNLAKQNHKEQNILSNKKISIEDIERKFFNKMDIDLRQMQQMRDKMLRDMMSFYYEGNLENKTSFEKNNYRKNNQKPKQYSFYTRTKYDEEKKEFNISIKVPENITMEDVDIDLENSIIDIEIEKETKSEIKQENKETFSQENAKFFRKITIMPETKATEKDLKINLEKNYLKIIVPII